MLWKYKFQGESYSEEELLALLNLTKDDPIYPAIMFAGGLGLRRSEALGVRWSRIDFEEKCVLLDTKIVETKENGKTHIQAIEEMKNKSSKRTLPLPDQVYEMLIEIRAKQELYKKMFKSSYSREYDDYVCVNQLGELMKPSYVTEHFAAIIQVLGLRKIRFHDLRHTFASILLSNDEPLIKVSRFLGHSDISTTVDIQNLHNIHFKATWLYAIPNLTKRSFFNMLQLARYPVHQILSHCYPFRRKINQANLSQ